MRGSSRVIARTGVAVLGLSLLMPTSAYQHARPMLVGDEAVVNQAVVTRPVSVESERVWLAPPPPDPIARRAARATPAPTPAPTIKPAPTITPAPVVAAVVTAPQIPPNGTVVIASWYGPGFFENRLPCWRWLQANNMPIQFLPDTWGVAHKTLPCGTMVTLSRGPNSVTVPVVDRGPYIDGREFDLSPRVKAALACTDLCAVVMQIR